MLGPSMSIIQGFHCILAWGAVYLSGVDKRLEEMERTMDRLADQFLIAEGARLPIAKGMSELKRTHSFVIMIVMFFYQHFSQSCKSKVPNAAAISAVNKILPAKTT